MRMNYNNVRAAISIGIATACGAYLVAESAKLNSTPTHASSSAPSSLIFDPGSLMDNKGGIVEGYEVAAGVDCPYEPHGSPWVHDSSTQIVTDPSLNRAVQWQKHSGIDPTLFVGEETYPESDGYSDIKTGWAFRLIESSGKYELDQIQAVKTGTQPSVEGPPHAIGQFVGSKVASVDLSGLELGGLGSWTDGTTTVSVSTVTNEFQYGYMTDTLGPEISVNIACAQ